MNSFTSTVLGSFWNSISVFTFRLVTLFEIFPVNDARKKRKNAKLRFTDTSIYALV